MYLNTEILVFVLILTEAIVLPVNSQAQNKAEVLASLTQLQLKTAQLDPLYREIIASQTNSGTNKPVNNGIPGNNVGTVDTWLGPASVNQGPFETPTVTGPNINGQLEPLVQVPIHGGWSLWSDWEPCNVTCGNGFQRRSRDCTNPVPKNGGIDCYALYQEYRVCVMTPCKETRLDKHIYMTDPALGPITHEERSRTLQMLEREQREKMATQNISFVPDVMKQPSQVKSQISLQQSINENFEQLLNQSTEVMSDIPLTQSHQLTSQAMLEKLQVVNPEMYLALQSEPISEMSLERLNQLISKFSPNQQHIPGQEIPVQQLNQPMQEIPFHQFNQPLQEIPFQQQYQPLPEVPLQIPNYQPSQETQVMHLNQHFAGMSLDQLNRLISEFQLNQHNSHTQEMPLTQLNPDIPEIPLNQHNQPISDIAVQQQNQPISNIAVQQQNQPEPEIPLKQHNQPISNIAVQQQNQPISNIAVQQQNQPISDIAVQQQNRPKPEIPLKQHNQPKPEIPLKQQNQPISNIAVQQNNQLISNIAVQQHNQPKPEIPLKHQNQPKPEIPLKQQNQPISNIAVQEHNQPISNIAVQQQNQPKPEIPLKQHNQPKPEIPLKQHNQPKPEIPLKQQNQPISNIAVQQHNQPISNIAVQQHNQPKPEIPLKQHNQPKPEIPSKQINQPVSKMQLNQANNKISKMQLKQQMPILSNKNVKAVSEVKTQIPLTESSPVMVQMAKMELKTPFDIMSQIAKTNKDILQSLGQLNTINNLDGKGAEQVKNNSNASSRSQAQGMQSSKPIASRENILHAVGKVQQLTSDIPGVSYSNPLDTFGSSNNANKITNDIPSTVSNVQQIKPMLQTLSPRDQVLKVDTPSLKANYPNRDQKKFASFQNLVMNKSLSELQTMVQSIQSVKDNGSVNHVLNEGAIPLSNDPKPVSLSSSLKQPNTVSSTVLMHPSDPDILAQALTKVKTLAMLRIPELAQFAPTKQNPNMIAGSHLAQLDLNKDGQNMLANSRLTQYAIKQNSPSMLGGSNRAQSAQSPLPQPANWTAWSVWSVCDKTCDNGIQTRTRTCDKPFGVTVELGCKGEGQQTRSCTLRPCPVVSGGWTKWMPWGRCGVTCGYGSQVRSRVCNSPTPRQSALLCPGPAYESKSCIMKECPIPGGWSNWGKWTPCDRTCWNGHAVRIRRCISPVPTFGGKDCTGRRYEKKPCNLKQCPVDGMWKVWTKWTPCSVSCGQGRQERARTCDAPPPSNGGRNCLGNPRDMQICNMPACPVDGVWNVWSVWTPCDVSCGQGTRMRARRCDVPPPANGGRPCPGKSDERKICNMTSCPVDGVWNVWTTWTSCDMSCGQGTKARARTCDAPPPSNGGKNCFGRLDEKTICNMGGCPVNGGWTKWSLWSKCDKSCDRGQKTRSRDCTNPRPANGGTTCNGTAIESQECFIRPCIVDGKWSVWSQWGECDVTCGDGTQERTRSCNNPAPGIGGLECPGYNRQMMSCQRKPCPIPISWAPWAGWGKCDAPCDIGLKRRQRVCNSTFIGQTGNKCIGDTTEYRICMPGACSDGGWSFWSPWTACSSSCDTGTRSRKRLCNSPAPSVVGKHCPGEPSQTESCKVKSCLGVVPSFTVETPTTIINGRLTFSNTIFNQGGDYSPSSGEFVCSQPGTYFFSSSLMKKRDFMRIDKVHCSIFKNNHTVIYVGVDPADDDTDKGNAQAHNSAVVHLKFGDVVSLQGCVSPPAYYMENWSSFTGFMIRPDM